MEIILVSDVDHLGKAGQTVTVKDGFARNFLIPQGLAVKATKAVKEQVMERQAKQEQKDKLLKDRAAALAESLKSMILHIPMPAGEGGKLHGVVTAADLAQALQEKGVNLEKHQVLLSHPVSELGSMEVPLRLHPEVTVPLKVKVVRK